MKSMVERSFYIVKDFFEIFLQNGRQNEKRPCGWQTGMGV